ncbi:hypothetical protein [Gluconobacter oxydans]|uniref:hypothetical protein n=1 Tax=Gluconobacter oxydans TaxID=442 RepID=UPI0039EBFFD3
MTSCLLSWHGSIVAQRGFSLSLASLSDVLAGMASPVRGAGRECLSDSSAGPWMRDCIADPGLGAVPRPASRVPAGTAAAGIASVAYCC